MKRRLLISVISLLFVSGWGHVLVAAFCPNMQNMPGCAMQRASTSLSGHEGMEMGDMQMPPSNTASEAPAVERPFVSCCAARPELPSSPVIASRGAEQSKQDLGAILKPALKTITPPAPSFTPPITSRQHAPPGTSTQRHVLFSVYLI